MASDNTQSGAEREDTDESLRVEREKADHALASELTVIDETADAVISKARARADEVLAEARAKKDRQSSTRGPSAPSPERVERERVAEDQTLQEERDDADDTVRAERAVQIALLVVERGETDKDLSKERERADRALAMRDEFLGIVSHDLRNILSAIVGFASLISTRVLKDDPAEQVVTYAQRIQRAATRMYRLIGDLIDVSNVAAGALAVTREVNDPTGVVKEAVDTLQAQASASGITLASEIAPSSFAEFDHARILQVLINLLSNAIKFTPPNGSIGVRVDRIGDQVRFAVTDTGLGIPAEKLALVFERFQQLEPGDRRGVGLGLYISKCIVETHGGRIWAESTIGQGSTFYFTIPAHGALEARAQEAALGSLPLPG
jgi:signal transduction histidine kinase